MNTSKKTRPICSANISPASSHPGEILQYEFMEPLGLSQYRLAKELDVPPIRISEIVRGKRAVTADTAIRLSSHFKTSPQFWLNLQNNFDLAQCLKNHTCTRTVVRK